MILKLRCDGLLSNFTFKFNLRLYNLGERVKRANNIRNAFNSFKYEVARSAENSRTGKAECKYCSPRHSPRFRPSSLELDGILRRGERERDSSEPATSFSTLQILASSLK